MNKLLVMIAIVVFSLPALGMGSAPKKEEYKLEILKMEIISSPEASSYQESRLRAKKFEFMPEVIKAKRGVPVRIIAASEDVTHGFYLEAFKVDKEIKPDKITVIEFTPNKSGTFEFRCNVFCGSGHGGMRGKLIVR